MDYDTKSGEAPEEPGFQWFENGCETLATYAWSVVVGLLTALWCLCVAICKGLGSLRSPASSAPAVEGGPVARKPQSPTP